ncbi:MAG: type II toxin-antitoxin system RelE/ParE family toxin [Cyclobacteriaceae bacterium]
MEKTFPRFDCSPNLRYNWKKQTEKVQKKILWTLRIIEYIDRIPEMYLKHLKNTSGLYEIRVQVGNNIFRIFCFFSSLVPVESEVLLNQAQLLYLTFAAH